jgi:hypothetical protein
MAGLSCIAIPNLQPVFFQQFVDFLEDFEDVRIALYKGRKHISLPILHETFSNVQFNRFPLHYDLLNFRLMFRRILAAMAIVSIPRPRRKFKNCRTDIFPLAPLQRRQAVTKFDS